MERVYALFSDEMKRMIKAKIKNEQHQLEEIRLRIGQPIELVMQKTYMWVEDYMLTKADLQHVLNQMTAHSLYRHEHELKQGFITLEGGHRVGFAGQFIQENNHDHHLTNIVFLNIRIAKVIAQNFDSIFVHLRGVRQWKNCCIIGAPQTGKTTLLRHLAKVIGNGTTHMRARKLFIVDERSEIASLSSDGTVFDVGRRTDILDNCPKHIGMMMGIRSMSPDVIMVDEIGSNEDVHAIKEAIYAGVQLICTIHAQHISDLLQKTAIQLLVKENVFDRYVLLDRKERYINVLIYNTHLEEIASERMNFS